MLARLLLPLTSPAFEAGGNIPTKHTGEGSHTSPQLDWELPEGETGVRSFAVICQDPDAPLVTNGDYGYAHWAIYNIPPATRSLAEGTQEHTAGPNDAGTNGYFGPMPPPGHGPHHYFFVLLALDRDPDLPAGLSISQLLSTVEPSVVGMGRLMGVYERS